jgi:hypothetical protein
MLRELIEQYSVLIAQVDNTGNHRLIGLNDSPNVLFDTNLPSEGFSGEVETVIYHRQGKKVTIYTLGTGWAESEECPLEEIGRIISAGKAILEGNLC